MAAGLSICIDRCDPAGNFCSVLSTSTRKSGHKSSCDHLPNGSKSCRDWDWTIYNFVSAEPHRSQTFWQNEKKHAGKYWYWQNQCGCGPSLISNRKYLDLYSELRFFYISIPSQVPLFESGGGRHHSRFRRSRTGAGILDTAGGDPWPDIGLGHE